MKSVQTRSFFWSVFSCIQSEYRKIRTRKNSIYGHFSRSAYFSTYDLTAECVIYGSYHYVKSVQIQIFFWSLFFWSIYWVNLCIQSKFGKIRTRKNFVFRYFSGCLYWRVQSANRNKLTSHIVGKGVYTPPFLDQPPLF